MKKFRRTTEFVITSLLLALTGVFVTPTAAADSSGISADTLGVVINLDDPLSRAAGEYYRRRRGIPAANIIRIHLPGDANTLSESEFRLFKTALDRQTPPGVQAYLLTWLRPYRVDCMSITTAVALGYSKDFCSTACRPTRPSPYFDSSIEQPMLDLGMRPAMLLAARDLNSARALIDRGIAADGTAPRGAAYLLTTSDTARNVRSTRYPLVEVVLGDAIDVKRINGEAIRGVDDVMFYFTGSVRVLDIASNRFLPGAVADHLTSTGGALLDTDQMSSLRWLEAGATGSYGTVTEPCNFPGKFPDPLIMMKHYMVGETLIEAYWKSVQMPGQGLFIGEPLARPWRVVRHKK